MKLWEETGKSAGTVIRATIKEQVADINRQVAARGVRAVNALRNAELEVLKGQRSGRVYKKPGTYGKSSKATKELMSEYGHKLRGGQLYRASAPGEPPARRTGNLRMHWSGRVETRAATAGGRQILAVLESGEKYAAKLEDGTPRMAPRPFVERIKEKAAPEIRKIYGEPYE